MNKASTNTIADQIELQVNGAARTLVAGATIEKLLIAMDLGKQRCAVEVNQRLIRRDWFSSHELHEGDKVEVVTLVGGG